MESMHEWVWHYFSYVLGGREPLDALSLRYGETSLPDLHGRPSLGYAVISMRNTSKCACVIQYRRFLTCVLSLNKIFFYKFLVIVAWEVYIRWEVFFNYHKQCLIMTNKSCIKPLNTFCRKRKIFREKNLNWISFQLL